MTLPRDSAAALLRKARDLDETRAYPELGTLLSEWDRDALAEEPELLFLRADVLRRLGRGSEALEDLEVLKDRIGRFGNVALHRRRLNLLGSIRFESGQIDEARDLWSAQLDDARAAGDEQFAARACNNLGVVATLFDELPLALGYYTRAVASYFQVGYERGLGQSHHNLGITYREMGFLHDADTHFRSAEHFARKASSEDEVARVAQERALLLSLLGDVDMARHTAETALGTYDRLGDPVGVAEVRRVLGLVALGEGEIELAEETLKQSLATAQESRAALLEAEVLAALSALRVTQGRPDEGAAEEQASVDRFEALGAQAWGRRALDRARAFAARGGQKRAERPPG